MATVRGNRVVPVDGALITDDDWKTSGTRTTPTAYTQTYSTADRTVPGATVSAVATTGATQVTPYGYAGAAQADAIPVAINALAADVLALKKVITALIDDLQAYGLVG